MPLYTTPFHTGRLSGRGSWNIRSPFGDGGGGAAGPLLNGIDVLIGDSIMNGYGVSSAADLGLDISGSYSNVTYQGKSGTSTAPSVPWTDTSYGSLRARSGTPDVGPELSFGRYMDVFGGDAGTGTIAKIAVNGSPLGGSQGWLPSATIPTAGANGGNLYSQMVTLVNAVRVSSGKEVRSLIVSLGTNDSADSGQASAWSANFTTFVTAFRAQFGANIPVIFTRVHSSNTTTGYSFLTTVRTQQDSYAASDSNSVLVNWDHIPLNPSDNIHPDANGSISQGNTLGRALANKLRPARTDNRVTTAAPWIQAFYEPGIFRTTVVNPRAPDARAGDFQLLIINSNLLNVAIPNLATANGFVEVVPSFTTVNSGIYVNTRIYGRAVTQVALDAAGGRLLDAVLGADNNDENLARYINIRGVSALTATNIERINTSAPNSSSLTLSLTGNTTLGPDRLLIAIGTGFGGGAIGPAGTPTCTGATGVSTIQDSLWTGSNKSLLYIGQATVAATGAYGPFTMTLSAGSYAVWSGVLLAIKP